MEVSMEFIVLGSGTCVPNPMRQSPGFAIRVGSQLIILDGGSGTLHQMARLNLDFRRVGYFCLTHFHPDHMMDLVPFLFASNYADDAQRTDSLELIGPYGLRDLYAKLHSAFGRWIEAQSYPLRIREVEEHALNFGEFQIETAPMVHSAPAIGFRFQAGGRSLVYSGDTEYCPQIVRLAQAADLLILDCSFPEGGKRAGHLTPSLGGKIARHAGCKKLLLTHFYPVLKEDEALEECRREFQGEILLATDGMIIPLPSPPSFSKLS